MELILRIWDPGEENAEGDDETEFQRARSALEDEVAALGGKIEFENHGVQAGDHVTMVLTIGTLLLQLPASLNSLLTLAEKLRSYLKAARLSAANGVSMGDAAADEEALMLLAYAEVRRTNPLFKTDPALVQVMPDGKRRYERTRATNEDFEGFPVGTFIFRIPDLHSERTHTIEIESNGRILDHRIRDALTMDAIEYLETEADEGLGRMEKQEDKQNRP